MATEFYMINNIAIEENKRRRAGKTDTTSPPASDCSCFLGKKNVNENRDIMWLQVDPRSCILNSLHPKTKILSINYYIEGSELVQPAIEENKRLRAGKTDPTGPPACDGSCDAQSQDHGSESLY